MLKITTFNPHIHTAIAQLKFGEYKWKKNKQTKTKKQNIWKTKVLFGIMKYYEV